MIIGCRSAPCVIGTVFSSGKFFTEIEEEITKEKIFENTNRSHGTCI